MQPKLYEPPQKIEDVPPKPPPRTFPVIEIPKKDAEQPKPLTPIIEQSKLPAAETAIRQFEFPDVTKAAVRPEGSMKNFEPKIASTPTLKHERMDFGESEVSAAKTVMSTENTKPVAETKVSPTNSVVRAMIHTSKSKSGNKKKNTLIASKCSILLLPLLY